MPGSRCAHPGGDTFLNLGIRPVAHHDLAIQAQAGVQEPGLAIAVGGLVEVHEIHVDLAPRQIAIELRMQMAERLSQGRQTANPHFGGRERMHPEDQARALGRVIGFQTELADFVRRGEHGLENDFQRQPPRAVQFLHDFARVCGHLLQRHLTVKVLTPGDIPDFKSIEVLHKSIPV